MLFRRPSTVALVTLSIASGAFAALAGCQRVEEPLSDPRPASSSSPTATIAPSVVAPPSLHLPLVAPTQLLTLPTSAYQAAIFADDEALELLTSSAAYRVLPGKEPLSRALDLGFGATVTRQSYVYWSRGAIWSEPRRAPNPAGATKLVALAEPPQRFVSDMAANEFAFLSRAPGNRYSIYKLEQRRVKTLYSSPGSIDALTMIGDALYFVERPDNAGWRIGRVKLAGGEPIFSASKPGRWPASLGGTQNVVYYDGGRRDVLSLSADLQQEQTLAKDFICSPLAVATNVYCSTMEGIFELSASEKPRQVVAASRKLITSLAVTNERLFFVTDVGGQGQDQLALNVVPLSKPNAAEAPR